MARIERVDIRADASGTIELVCERTADESSIEMRTFVGDDEFGLLVDGLEPDERVSLFVEQGVARE